MIVRILLSLISFFIMFSSYADTPPPVFTLNTNAFLDQGTLPVLYTCDDKGISPELDWTNLPAKTETLAIILSDAGAAGGTFYHWVLYNIPKTVTTLTEGIASLPAGVEAGNNTANKPGYYGPCPPKNSIHTYLFTLYALDTKLSLAAGTDGKTVINAMQKHILGKAELSAVYTRWEK